MGHALNKVLKDIVNKYKTLQGFKVNFVPGWDCHGLPIELKVLQNLKSEERKNLTVLELRKKATEYANIQINDQKEGFKRWGIWGDWDNPYLTLKKTYESAQIGVFGEMFLNGYIYRGLKPVHWSPSSRTALAEAELEYPDQHFSKSVYVSFSVERLNEYIFSYDQEETLFQVVFDILLKKRMKISFAESCTGGMISNELTNISGSSKVYGFGLNTYSNSAKRKILNVSDNLLKKYGAVSREVVRVMVKNLIKLSKSDIGIAVSGIAGPSGGSKNKPVGTVFVAYYLNNKIITRKYFFTGTRKSIKLRTTLEVYDFIRKNLL